MNEDRILDKLDRIAEDLSASRSDIKNLHQYVEAVNANGKVLAKEFRDHELKEDAHGLGGGRRTTDTLLKVFTVFIAALGALLGIKNEVNKNNKVDGHEIRP